MHQRPITQRPWNERPEQADQTVNVLLALGFEIQIDFLDQKFDSHGTLVSERFTKRTGPVALGYVERVTVDYTWVRTYLCGDCDRVCLAADKDGHSAFHTRVGR